jgi:hypothetical protein
MQLEITKKINFKKFFTISIIPTIICIALADNFQEVLAISVVYIATVIYLFMFAEAIYELTGIYKEKENNASKKRVVILFVGKLVILVSALLFGVQIMGSRIIIPVLNYIIQVIFWDIDIIFYILCHCFYIYQLLVIL